MTDASYVHLIMVIDRSGSMADIRSDTEGGIHAAVQTWIDTSGGDKRTVSLYQFDTQHDTVLFNAPLEKALDYKLEPRGCTALLDAIGQAITDEGRHLKHTPEDERPGQVVVIIATDGLENSSKEYTRDRIKEMIEHQQDKYGWKMVYIGADQNAFAEAGSIGIKRDATLRYSTTATAGTYDVLTTTVQAGTASTSSRMTFTQAQRDAAAGK